MNKKDFIERSEIKKKKWMDFGFGKKLALGEEDDGGFTEIM